MRTLALFIVLALIFMSGFLVSPLVSAQNNTGAIPRNATNAAPTPPAQRGPTITDPNLELQLVYGGLESPTNMEFLGPNDILVTYKNDGTVRRIVDGTMLEEPVLDVEVANLVERGMLGIAIAKRGEGQPPYVFLYYTEAEQDGEDEEKGAPPLGNRLYRYEFINGTLENDESLINIPASRGASHNGGKVLIGPDNNVYLVVGDIAAHKTRSENYFNGTLPVGTSVIWRITQDGESAGAIFGRDEPMNKFYAYGIRNSFGMDFDPVTGKLWDTENGPTYGDEINIVEPGFNSGWRVVSGFPNATHPLDVDKDLVKCLYCTRTTGALDHWINSFFYGIQDGKYSDPEFSWHLPVAPTAIKFLNSDKLGKQYENDMFVGDVLPGNLYHFELNENRDGLVLNGSLADKVADNWTELAPVVLVKGFGGITDIDVGPDGYLYILTYYQDPGIYRIVPKGTPLPINATLTE